MVWLKYSWEKLQGYVWGWCLCWFIFLTKCFLHIRCWKKKKMRRPLQNYDRLIPYTRDSTYFALIYISLEMLMPSWMAPFATTASIIIDNIYVTSTKAPFWGRWRRSHIGCVKVRQIVNWLPFWRCIVKQNTKLLRMGWHIALMLFKNCLLQNWKEKWKYLFSFYIYISFYGPYGVLY